MKNKVFMYMVGYDSNFKLQCRTGWGCGYVRIPLKSKVCKDHFARIKSESSGDEYGWVDNYFRHPMLEQEITFTETKTMGGVDYLVIGFDTAHSFNNDTHDFNYVFNETVKILELIKSLC